MAKKLKIPKKIAGVRVPKVLRKSTLMRNLLGSEVGRQLVADALVAAATAAAAVLVSRPQVRKAGAAVANKGEDAAKVAKDALKSAAAAVTESLGNAARVALGQDQPSRSKLSRTH